MNGQKLWVQRLSVNPRIILSASDSAPCGISVVIAGHFRKRSQMWIPAHGAAYCLNRRLLPGTNLFGTTERDFLMNTTDLQHLQTSINVAQRAREHGNHPFGAILVDENNQ